MKTPAILFTGAAALALCACGGGAEETPADGETDVTVIEENDAAPVATETTVVREVDGDDSVTVSDDGVTVDVDSDNTWVRADEDGASVTVSE